MRTQRYADNSLKIRDPVHESEIKFGKCLSCSQFHTRNSCAFRNAKCFKCGEIGQSPFLILLFISLQLMLKSIFLILLSVSDDHLSSSTTSKSDIELHSRQEFNETQSPCETTVSYQSTFQISHVIVLDMVFPNDSHISDEISYKSEEDMLSEPSHGRKPGVVLIDADFPNDLLLCNDILNKFEETISEESNPDVISNIICICSCGKLSGLFLNK
ncbi:unnamed protein product [Schistosoma curassoni]|uniref:Nucleic acid binding protein n=1 Tax=Schistosoma curassoni TaxID=6186 RepID=A0A183JUX5_9TREM|nr:unnamed protein product [Schistosoma curassoni]